MAIIVRKAIPEHKAGIIVLFQRVNLSAVSNALTDHVEQLIHTEQYPAWIKREKIGKSQIQDYLKRAIDVNLIANFAATLSGSNNPNVIKWAIRYGITKEVAALYHQLATQFRLPAKLAELLGFTFCNVSLADGTLVISLPENCDLDKLGSYVADASITDRASGVLSAIFTSSISCGNSDRISTAYTLLEPKVGSICVTSPRDAELIRSLNLVRATQLNENLTTTTVIKEFLLDVIQDADALDIVRDSAQIRRGKSGLPEIALGPKFKYLKDIIGKKSSFVEDTEFYFPESRELLIEYGIHMGTVFTTMNDSVFLPYIGEKFKIKIGDLLTNFDVLHSHEYSQYFTADKANTESSMYQTWRSW